MVKLIFILTFQLFTSTFVTAQKQLNKDEIVKSWKSFKSEELDHDKSIRNLPGDSLFKAETIKLIDSLNTTGVDSIIICTASYPGYYTSDPCTSGIYPIKSCIIWKFNSGTYYKKLNGTCMYRIHKIESSEIFDFVKINYQNLLKDTFMPVIYKAFQNKKGNVTYSVKMIDHEPNYCISYLFNQVYESQSFTELQISDTKNLFYKDNLKLKSYALWLLIKEETMD